MQSGIEEIRGKLAPAFERYGDRLAAVYLFGSHAVKRSLPLSDIDLAVLLDPQVKVFSDLRFQLYADFSRALATNRLDLTLLNTLDNLFILDEIIRTGVLIYDGRPQVRFDFEHQALHRALDFKQQRLRVMGV